MISPHPPPPPPTLDNPPVSAVLKPAFSKIELINLKIRKNSDFCVKESLHFILYEGNFLNII